MAIALGSINTGLPKDIVKKIIDAEKIPIKKMEKRKSNIVEKKKLVQNLTNLISSLKKTVVKNNNKKTLRSLKANFDKSLVGVTIDQNTAIPGNYQFEILKLAKSSSVLSSAFADPDKSYTGVGHIQYQLPDGEEVEIYVDSKNASLNKIARLINSDSKNGMVASVISDHPMSKKPWRLLINLQATGDPNDAKFPEFYFIDGDEDFYIKEERKAQNAIIKINGFTVELPENKVKDAITGLNIDLKKTGKEFDIDVSEDKEAFSLKVKKLIDTLNKVFDFINKQSNIDGNTDTSKTLGGDLILQTIKSRLQNSIFKSVPTYRGFKKLGDIGILFQRDGLIKVDEKKLDFNISEDIKMVSEIFLGQRTPGKKSPGGFLENFLSSINSIIQYPNGILNNRNQNLQNRIKQIDQRIESKLRIIDKKETALKDKFAKLEGVISKMKSQQASIEAIRAMPQPSIPKFN